MALRREVIDFVRLDALDDAREARRIRQVAVMQLQALVRVVYIALKVVDPVGVEQRRATLDAMHLVALVDQQLGQV
jgi:hypothetical protein